MTMHVSSLPVWLGVGGPSTISVSPASSSVSEGSSLTFNVFAVYPNNTILYFNLNTSASTATSADFTTYSGSFLITNKAGSFTVTLATDSGAETETFCMNVLTGSITGTVIATSSSVSITDTSPIYTITPRLASVNEGSSLIFDVGTTNVSDGTVLYYNLNTSLSTATAADFTSYSGSVTITSSAATFTVTVAYDAVSDNEYFYMDLKTGSISGAVVATSSQVSITNIPPTYSVTPRSGSVAEGGSLVFDVSTTYVPNSTVLYYNLSSSSTATSADFTSYSGSCTITSNASTFSITVAYDLVSDSEYFYIDLKTDSISGTVVATSSQVNIVNVPPTVSPRASTVSEGSSLIFDVVAYVADGTVLYYNLSSSSTATSADFTSYSGSCTITSNASTFSVTLATDMTVETEYFYMDLKTDSISGTIIATSSQVTISDYSPTFAFSSFPSTMQQGGNTSISVTGTNVTNGQVVYFRLSTATLDYTATSSDFVTYSGSFTMTSNSGGFNIKPYLGYSLNGGKTFRIELYLSDGTIVAISSICTILTATATIELLDTVNLTQVATSNITTTAYAYPTRVVVKYRITTTNVSTGASVWWGLERNSSSKIADVVAFPDNSLYSYTNFTMDATGVADREFYAYGTIKQGNFWTSAPTDQVTACVLRERDFATIAQSYWVVYYNNPKQIVITLDQLSAYNAVVRLPWTLTYYNLTYSAVAIGGGGGGGWLSGSNYGAGGGGGALVYKNNISVSANYEAIYINIGQGGYQQSVNGAGSAGTNTDFYSSGTTTVTAPGGKAASGSTPGGVSTAPTNGTAGFSGGAGSYTAHTTWQNNSGSTATYTANGSGNGGGTGLLGPTGGGTLYGTGGAGTTTNYTTNLTAKNGAIRIMWGTGRSYPSTNVGDVYGGPNSS